MRVLQINKFLYPYQGGIESVSESIIQALNSSKIDLYNICFTNNINDIHRENVKRFYSRISIFSQPISFKYMLYIIKNIRKFNACIVHFPNIFALLPLLFTRNTKIYIFWHSDIRQQNILLRILFGIFEKILISKSHSIIFPTIAHKLDSSHNFSKVNSHIIPLTLNNEDIAYETYKYRKNIEYKTTNRIIFIGRLVEYKGLEFLIKAIKSINAEVIIIGSGPLEKSLKNISKNQKNVTFMGRLDNLENEFKKASLLVLPSINAAEMFGIVQIEAFARGIPVISTKIKNSGVPYVNIDNLTGYLCEPSSVNSLQETIIRFLKNPDFFSPEKIRNVYDKRYSNDVFKANLLNLFNT